MDLHAQSLWLHAAFIVAFLVSGPVRSEEPSAAPPSEWGRVAPRLLDQGCPAISGSFRVIGEAAPTNKSNANQRIYGLLFHPRGSKAVTSEPLSEIVATDGLTFSIVQNDAKSFEALLIASDGATRRRLTFERGLGDYTCSDGNIIIARHLDISSEGVRGSSDIEVKITKSEDGSLVLLQKIAKHNRAFPALSDQTEINFIRFPPVEHASERPNLSLNRTVSGGRPSAPAGTAG